ncbi:ABC transporter ATP-binding protein [uncultured Desulfobacter sp.]|uniref:ABC transporter ATP-binding protein n=1 Tax=uncultured Desulfobacter sp. TaxID=240139 RepID=UPI0029C7F0BC|nr:ABC transporter ATP-binding protein [uncultured Desulfobacter sp.]
MKGLLNTITHNNIYALKKPVILGLVQSILQGQPYFVVLFVIVEFLTPLLDPGSKLNTTRLVLLVGWLAVALILLFLVGRKKHEAEQVTAYTLSAEGRISLGNYLRKLSMGFFKDRDPGDITALMLQDYTNVETLLSFLLMDALSAVVLPVIFSLFLAFYDWQMTLITLIPIPIGVVLAIITRAIMYRFGKLQLGAKHDATSRMLEYLEGMPNIKSYNLQGQKFSRLKTSLERLKVECIKLEGVVGPAVMAGVWCLYAGTPLIMLTGVYFIIQGSLTISHFLFFLIVGTRIYDPLLKALTSFAELSYYSISATRIGQIYENKPLPEPAAPEVPVQYDIEFRDVSFRYHHTDVLKGVSFSVPSNTMTALVGPSGSGKTTITRLLARFWDVGRGEIRVGGIPVTRMKNEDLLSMISIVFQDVYLFNDTILANIKVGNADASMEEVIAVAKKAHCHAFIEEMENGYETIVGEGGATLSGGERQRIAIARAMLKDAPVILLDEATASLDPENELYIQEAISELIKGRTLIVIAHRLSTITKADQILVLNNGILAEQGTHEALLSRDSGLYQRMWEEQQAAHLWKLCK